MKFMGSKRAMLTNGLGTLILNEVQGASRFVDIFCGSGAVTTFVATQASIPVVASDLQAFAVALAGSVVTRTDPVDVEALRQSWLNVADHARQRHPLWKTFVSHKREPVTPRSVTSARTLAASPARVGPILRAYGGYYFNPWQALTFDYLIKYLPAEEPERIVCLAALIQVASRTAAAPGHTAQPFRPTEKGLIAIAAAWKRDPLDLAVDALKELASKHALEPGSAVVRDAMTAAGEVTVGDLVFVDPPYSAVQYSRFYHVLETVAKGRCSTVDGAGRYPAKAERPQSDFCLKTKSSTALGDLLDRLAAKGARVILTFPKNEASNGLSGRIVCKLARKRFDVQKQEIVGRFSTLGGNNSHRASRLSSRELVLLLVPK